MHVFPCVQSDSNGKWPHVGFRAEAIVGMYVVRKTLCKEGLHSQLALQIIHRCFAVLI